MQKWVMLSFLSMFFTGLSTVIAKFGLKNISSDLGLVVRTSVLFSLVLLNFFAWQNVKEFSNLTKDNIFFLALSGVTTSLSWICYYRAMQTGVISQIVLIDKGSLIISIILATLFLKEPLTPKVVVGAFFILLGLGILVWK
jgi:transporter family protein